MKKLLACSMSLILCGAAVAGMTACGGEEENPMGETTKYNYSVYAPDGAPALALCNFMNKMKGVSMVSQPQPPQYEIKYDFHVVDASTIQTFVTGENPTADFCVLPVNAAAKILGKGTTYQMLGTVTNGNLYFLSTGDNAVLTAESLETSLIGKKVGVVQLANVPGLTLQAVLNDYNIDYQIVQSTEGEMAVDKVNLIPFAPENVTPAGGCDYYLCPEPVASAKIKGTASSGNPFKMAGDLQQLYGSENGYPQAVLVAKKSVIAESQENNVIKEVLQYFEGSANYLANEAPEKLIELLADVRTEGLTPSFNANNLTKEVVANCSVRFMSGATCKDKVKSFLEKLIAVNADSTAIPSDDFFYMG